MARVKTSVMSPGSLIFIAAAAGALSLASCEPTGGPTGPVVNTALDVVAEEDVTPPSAHSVVVTPSEIDVNEGEGQVIALVDVTDDLSGVGLCFLDFQSPSGAQKVGQAAGGGEVPYAMTIFVPQFSETGRWTLSRLRCGDQAGNFVNYFPSGPLPFDPPFFDVVPGNLAPVPIILAADEANEGSAIVFDGTSSFDPDGDPLTFAWDFGDGSGASGEIASHTFLDDGTYAVSLATHDGEMFGTSGVEVRVWNVPPTVNDIPSGTLIAGESYRSVVTFFDPGTLDTWSATVDYGNGNSEEVVPSGMEFFLNARYMTPGSYVVRVVVADDDAGEGVAETNVEVIAFADALQGIRELIDQLRFAGTIESGTSADFQAHLTQAGQAILKENPEKAVAKLEAFIARVQSRTPRFISAADAEPLVYQANRLIQAIESF